MEFLPLEMHHKGFFKPVYAGFGKRFLAAIIDFILLIVFALFLLRLQTINIPLAILSFVIINFFFAFYNIYFNAMYGGTLGKLTVGVRVTNPDGSRISWKESFMRTIVDVFIGIVMLALQLYAISIVDHDAYLSSGIGKRGMMLIALYPYWYKFFNPASQIWVWSELIVLLFNKRKRAIHDFIAGTVVINKEFVAS